MGVGAVLGLLAVAGLTTDLSGALDGPGSSLMWFALGARGPPPPSCSTPRRRRSWSHARPRRERVAVRMLLPGGLILVWLAFVGRLQVVTPSDRCRCWVWLSPASAWLPPPWRRSASYVAWATPNRAPWSPGRPLGRAGGPVVQPLPGHVVVLQTGPLQGSSLAFWCATGVVVVRALAWGSVDR